MFPVSAPSDGASPPDDHRMTITSANQAGRSPTFPSVDTRAHAGPDGRLYTASFASVWDRLLDGIRARRLWDLVHCDEDLGLITVSCRGFLTAGKGSLTIWVSLDDNGLTRVDLRSVPNTRLDLGASERRVRNLLDRLDRNLGPGTRVTG
jgi:hypothetical protein